MKTRLCIMLGIAAIAAAGAAHAQLFKCKGPDGKIVYSDRACDSSATTGALPPGVTNRAHENEAKAAAEKAAADKAAAEEKLRAEALVEAAKKAGLVAPATAPAAAAPPAPPSAAAGRYELTNADRERLRSLELDANRAGAYSEQKAAARLEMDSIRTGREARLSAEDRARRENLHVDLVSTDARKRTQALRDLQSLYYR